MGARGPAGLGSVRRAAQRAAVPRLCLHAHMRGHGGCVSTVAWDECGEALLSGSDDLSLCVWRAADLTLRARARTAHSNNIFCALRARQRLRARSAALPTARCASCTCLRTAVASGALAACEAAIRATSSSRSGTACS